MLLAGGQGSRLYMLTDKTAKPAVTFGGKYRLIDFPLSNCANSGIDTVGVLTQYQPLVLNEYIGSGKPWDLDCSFGGVRVLPPYQGKKSSDWYCGTANAIWQNMNFIDMYAPDYVLVLSGDHVYKMDYSGMIAYHKKKDADCTIAVLNVPIEEASRFGIMNCADDGRILEFEEKPNEPKSTLASMGIYVFKTSVMREYLERDSRDTSSSKDFGKNVIPAMLAGECKMYAYPFDGYWKDVGTIDSLWEANMDLLGDAPRLSLRDAEWCIYSRNQTRPPHLAGLSGEIVNSLITEGCEIYGKVENSVLSGGVIVGRGAVVRDSVIMSDVLVEEDTIVNYSIIDSNTVIGQGSTVGRSKADGGGICVVGSGIEVPPQSDLRGGEMVDSRFFTEIAVLEE